MKKLKLLFIFLLVTSFSCRSYPVIPALSAKKIDEINISSNLGSFFSWNVDSNNNIYFIHKNTIKKLNSKNELISIGGKEKPDLYPKDEVIDGNVNSAKFGYIEYIKYIESKDELYFTDSYTIEKGVSIKDKYGREINLNKEKNEYVKFIRKITKDNEIKTILKLDSNLFEVAINKNLILFARDFKANILKKINLDSEITEKEFKSIFIDENTGLLTDSEDTIYLIKDANSLYKLFNDVVITLFGTNTTKSILLDENDNLYVIEDPRKYNYIDRKYISGFNESILLHKIPKKELDNNNIGYYIGLKKYVVAYLPKDYNYIAVSDKTKTLFAQKANSIYKIKLEK